MLLIRKIKEEAWFKRPILDADSVSDLGTTNHELSVWHVNSDKSNVDEVALALALTRDEVKGMYVVFIEFDKLVSGDGQNIRICQQEGTTAFRGLRNAHRNFIVESIRELEVLAKFIYGLLLKEVNYKYYSEPELLRILADSIANGKLSEADLASEKKDKWKKYYKRYIEESR